MNRSELVSAAAERAGTSASAMDAALHAIQDVVTDALTKGEKVTIPGFAVPLNFHPDSREIRQFLLVPFYGACIHVPPPASNQIILVDAGYVSGEIPQQKDVPIEVTGRLIVDHAESDLAVSSYRINATRIVPYH